MAKPRYHIFLSYRREDGKVKECDGTHSECCARRVPHSEEIARHIERRYIYYGVPTK